jgi:1,2-diacylglycerol 3-alpha-glucosyltransferase
MRVLYALDTYRPNIDGVAIASERLAKGLVRLGHEVAVVAPGRRLADYVDSVDEIPVYRVRALRVLSERWWLPFLPGRGVAKAIADFAPDVVTVSLPFLLSRAAVSAAKRFSLPIVGVTGTMPEWLTSNLPLPRSLADRANPAIWSHIASYYDQCDAIVGVTRTALGLLQDHGLERPGYVISNGVSLTAFRPRKRDDALAARLGVDDRPVVMYAGRLDAEKRMDVWLKAAAALLDSGHRVQFLIVGDGSERRQLEADVAALGIASSVRFTGFLSNQEYSAVFSLASVFAIASPAELQSIVTLEAAACGLPIVAVNAGALPELVEDGKNGYLFDLNDADSMAGALRMILGDERQRSLMGRRSRATAEQHSLDESVRRYERVFYAVSEERVAQHRLVGGS